MITKNKSVCGGEPTIQGTRITVKNILEALREECSFGDICEMYSISYSDIKECLNYAVSKL